MRPKSKLIAPMIVIVFIIVLFFVVFSVYKERSHENQTTQEHNLEVSWKEFVDEANSFTVLFPTLPQHVGKTVPLGEDVVRYDMYLSQDHNGTTLMINQIHYPAQFDTSNVYRVLEGVLAEMVQGNSQNSLVSKKEGEFKNSPSLDFVLRNQDVTIQGRAFLKGKELYVLTVVSRNSDIQKVFDQFMDSFQMM